MAKSKRSIKSIGNLSIVLMVLVIAAMAIIPVSARMLNFHIQINLIFALLTLLIALSGLKRRNLHFFPMMLFLSILYNLAVNVAVTRIILTRGPGFDVQIVWTLSRIIMGAEIESLVIGLMFFIVCFIIQIVVVIKWASRIYEVNDTFIRDNIDVFNSDTVTEEILSVKNDAHFLDSLVRSGKFLSFNEDLKIFIVLLNAFGGMLIGILHRGEPLNEAVVSYSALAVGSGLVFMIPAFLQAASVACSISRFSKKEKFKEDYESTVS